MALPVESAAKIQCNTPEAPARIWRAETPARLEHFLAERLPNASRESIRRALAGGRCQVDSVVRPYGFRLAPGSVVTLDADARLTEVVPESIPLEVLFEDEFLLAVNKPAGMLAHPTARERTGTVANALRGMGYLSSHILHRLDRDTSGVLLAAKTLEPRSPLARIFELRKVEKRYLAMVAAPVPWEERILDLPIGRDAAQKPQWGILDSGAAAETRLRVLSRSGDTVLLEAEPVTGRTNQIRIHCAAAGHPLLGDRLYGGLPAPRLLLHAWKLSIPSISLDIAAPPPPEFLSG